MKRKTALLPRIALVSSDVASRRALADYLTTAGFKVHEYTGLDVPSAFSAIVFLSDDERFPDRLLACVRSWLKLTATPRVVVITSKPSTLRALIVAYPTRLVVLAAPAFGWDLVDVLRGKPEQGPQQA